MAAALGSLVVSLEANTAKFTAGMDKAAYQTDKAMKEMKKSAAVVGAAIGTMTVTASVGLAMMVKNSIDAADNLRDMSQKTGVAVETLNGLGFAASQAGGSLDSIGAAAGKLNKSIAEAASGSKDQAEAFKLLGINVEDSSGKLKTADVVMAEIADKFEQFKDGPEKSAIALAIFSKAGADMIPVLNDGGKAMRENIAYAKEYSGLTIELANASDEFNDTMGKLKIQQDGFSNAMAKAVLPILQAVSSETLTAAENSNKFELATAAVRTTLETFVVVGSETSFLLVSIGRELGALAAQADALGISFADMAQGPAHMAAALATSVIKGEASLTRFSAISEAAREDAKKARTEHDAFIARVLDRTPATQTESGATEEKPKGTLGRLSGSGADTSAAIAKAQLALDLERIKSASDEITNIYSSSEKIMEAMRAANLLTEGEYYTAKRGFLNLNSQAEEQELQKELGRLNRENLSGKDKIDNEKKIAEIQAKLNKSRQDAAANGVVLDVQETGAKEKLAKAYINATAAAQDYINTINKRNDREIAGLGKGAKSRDEESGRNQIEDKLITEKQTLARDLRNNDITQDYYDKYLEIARSTYEQELASYNSTIDRKNAKNADWLTGANEAIQNYANESANVARQMEGVFTNAFQSMEDAIVEFCKTGKLDFNSLAESILSDLVRIQVKAAMSSVTSGLGSWMSGLFGSSSHDTNVSSMQQEASNELALSGARAGGGPVSSGGTYLVGEKGPELLTMGASGYVTPNSALGGGGGIGDIIIHNTMSDKAEATVKPKMNNGKLDLEVFIRQVVAKDQKTNGTITQGFASTFNLARAY